jgi:hypothetical protein
MCLRGACSSFSNALTNPRESSSHVDVVHEPANALVGPPT